MSRLLALFWPAYAKRVRAVGTDAQENGRVHVHVEVQANTEQVEQTVHR